jgi:hypothetical protein
VSQSAQATARALRADFSAADGLRASALAGAADDWVAFQCGGDGIEVTGGSFDLRHATTTSNTGMGVRRGVGHSGLLVNSIAFANTAGEVTGFAPGEVFDSNAGASFNGFDGNLSADPLFTDAANGDLSLQGGSPCIDAAGLGAALLTITDQLEHSRVLDDDLDGILAPDMGAFERAAYVMSVTGVPRLGTAMSFTTNGSQLGVVLYSLGFLTAEFYVPPFGFALLGLPGSTVSLGLRLTGVPRVLPLPGDVTLAGTEFGVQGIAVPLVDPTVGSVTNRYRGRMFP